jgi:ribonucleoside-diphosphate reductase alpha chain
VQVRALDNVLDLTWWPLPQQAEESRAKRRIGVGFTGLGNTLAMLRLRYDAPEGRDMAARIARSMRDAAYAPRWNSRGRKARSRCSMPTVPGSRHLRQPPRRAAEAGDPQHGIRNSHLLSIAPTGTVSLAFADNASNGIEPPFSWTYRARSARATAAPPSTPWKTTPGACSARSAATPRKLPPYFVSALEMPAADHLAMMEAVQPFIDTAISKTVNVPADYPYAEFQGLYLEAWRAGLKGLATYRPNEILGSVLRHARERAEADRRKATRCAP